MKIQTSAGEVELTAEMICRGMVFQSEYWDHPDARGGVLTMATSDGGDCWKSTVGLGCSPLHAQRFLGCDPEVATRADCERFGVHGDAGTHGFARLRDGGAVDLRRETPEGAVFERDGKRHRLAPSRRPAPDWLRFIGLDAPAHSGRALREKFCCDVLNRHMDACCSLAIGAHDTHEDIATGVKWSAKPTTSEGLAVTFWNGLDRSVGESLYPNLAASAARMSGDAGGMYVPNASIPPSLITYGTVRVWLISRGYTVSPDGERGYERFEHVSGHWMRLLADERLHETEAGVEFFAAEMKISKGEVWRDLRTIAVATAMPHGMGVTVVGPRPAMIGASVLGLFVWLRRLWEGNREGREAALVVLVAAVPEGLDPIGWRAAVLAQHEACTDEDREAGLDPWQSFEGRLRFDVEHNGDGLTRGSWAHVAWSAYQRALAPRQKVAPERKGTTWKTRGPVLPVDDGRDD